MTDQQLERGPVEKQCRKHGPYMAEHVVSGVYMPCPGCCAENEERMAEEAKRAERIDTFDREAFRLTKAGVEKRFESATFATWVPEVPGQRAAFDWAVEYATKFPAHFKAGRCAMFVGKPGTGKTHLAFGILRHCMEASEKFDGRLISVANIFRRIKATWDRGARETEEQAIKAFVEPHLLIIDEIGVQFGSPAEQNLLYEVVNGRYLKMLPTIVVSNLSTKDLRVVVGERVFDRLRENDGAVVVFDWKSHRVTG